MRQSYPERQHNIERLGCSDCLGPFSATKWRISFNRLASLYFSFLIYIIGTIVVFTTGATAMRDK